MPLVFLMETCLISPFGCLVGSKDLQSRDVAEIWQGDPSLEEDRQFVLAEKDDRSDTKMNIVDKILPDGKPIDSKTLRHYLAAREYLSVHDFGAVGDGVADDSAAIQAAVNAAKGCPIWVPPGNYRLDKQLLFSAPANNHAPAPRLYGAGPLASRFLCRASGPALLVTQEAGYRFLKNGVLSGLAFVGNGGKANQHALSLSGAWEWLLEDIEISDFGGDAIHSSIPMQLTTVLGNVQRKAGNTEIFRQAGGFMTHLRRGDALFGEGIAAGAVVAEIIGNTSLRMSLPAQNDGVGDLRFSGNSDAFQSIVKLCQTRIRGCGGWGINASSGLGLILNWQDCTLYECRAGGALLSGTANFEGGIIAGNGAKANPDITAGLRLIRVSNRPQILSVKRIEFDGNAGAQMRLEWVANAWIFQCRFISHLQSDHKLLQPPVGVMLGARESGGGAAEQVRIDQCAFRADVQGKAAYAGIELGAPGTYNDIEILQPLWITIPVPPEQVKVKGIPHPDSVVRMIEAGKVTLGAPLAPPFAMMSLPADKILPSGQTVELGMTEILRGNKEILTQGLPMYGLWQIQFNAAFAGLADQEKGLVTIKVGSWQCEVPFSQAKTASLIVSGNCSVLSGRGAMISVSVKRLAGSSDARITGGKAGSSLLIQLIG